MSKDKKAALQKTAEEFAKKLARTLNETDPKKEAAYQKWADEQDRKVSEALARHMKSAKRPK